jgi:DNA-binding phage protein
MKNKGFRRFDAADYLKTEEDIIAYLDAAIAEAREAGVTREGLYKALSGEGNPSFATIVKVAQALGLRLSFQGGSLTQG